MTSEFKVGDRVRLTGDDWYGDGLGPGRGEVVEITRVNEVSAFFEWGGECYIYGDYSAELVTDEEGQEVTKFKVGDRVRLTGDAWAGGRGPQYGDVVTVTGFDSDGDVTFLWSDDPDHWVIEEGGWEAELVTDEDERQANDDTTVEKLDAIDPDHYKFPGGTEVRHISAHLTSFGGQAVQYVARSTRLDGKNKGDRVENLKKAIRMIEWEIERIQNDE